MRSSGIVGFHDFLEFVILLFRSSVSEVAMLFHKKNRPHFPDTRHRYFGYENGRLRGAVFCERFPEKKFSVALCDIGGNVISQTLANRDIMKGDIPPGYGFEIPIPIEWGASSQSSVEFQFRVLETGKVFPAAPRSVMVDNLRQLYDPIASRRNNSRHVLYILENLPVFDQGKLYVIVCTHEMTRTGAPLIALEIVRVFKERYNLDSIVLSVGLGGALEDEFQASSHAVIDGLNETTIKSGISEKLLKVLRTFQPQAILINSISTAPLVEFVQHFPLRRVALIHEYPQFYSDLFVKRYISICDTLIFPANDVKKEYSLRGLTEECNPHTNFKVIPQGCYMLRRQKLSLSASNATKVELPPEITKNGHLIVGCGSVDIRKGFDWFCQFVIDFSRHSSNASDVKFAWIGKIEDQNLFDYAIHDLQTAGVIDRFIHLGEISDVGQVLELATAFVLSSRRDPFPSVVQEALLKGVPVIGFDAGQGTSEMIANEGLGEIIPYLDIAAAVKALDRCISDSSFLKMVRHNGPLFVHERLSFEKYVDSLAGILLRPRDVVPPIILLGFHRSGTSFFSRWLQSASVFMGPPEAMLVGYLGNPDGHYEDRAFLDFHVRAMKERYSEFMNQWGGDYCIFLPDYENDWWEALPFAETVARCRGRTSPWGWKDPRTLLFVDLWAHLFPKFTAILVYRHPLEVFYSVMRRGTDPYAFQDPIAVFEAYFEYYRRILQKISLDPTSLCYFSISSPPRLKRLEELHQFLTRNYHLIASFDETIRFDETAFRQLAITEAIHETFRSHFPAASRTFEYLEQLEREAIPKSNFPTKQQTVVERGRAMEWLHNTLKQLSDGKFQLREHLALISRPLPTPKA